MNSEELYKQNIIDHYKNPRNKREIKDNAFHGSGINASCGDKIDFYVKIAKDAVQDASFTGEGCAISQAAASMLTEKAIGKSLAELRSLSPGDIYTMLGVKISPGRANCALLAYQALSKALAAIK
ncbi:MAG: Fe-S cluster assembly sulfur transfer protein SufU [Patescibacteria group bacterium]